MKMYDTFSALQAQPVCDLYAWIWIILSAFRQSPGNTGKQYPSVKCQSGIKHKNSSYNQLIDNTLAKS